MNDLIFSIASLIISASVFFYSNTFAATGKNAGSLIKNPALYPQLIAIVMFILSALLLIITIIKKNRNKLEINAAQIKKVFLLIVVILCYIGAMSMAGYIISTILFSFVAILIYSGSKKQAVIYSVAITLFIYFSFNYLLNVTLPQGLLFS